MVRDGKLVGIITETDMFKVFLELFAAREEGTRVTMLVPGEKGTLAKIAGAIAEMGGNILALGTIMGEDPTNYELTTKVTGVPEEELVSAMESLGMEMRDTRYCTAPACD